MNNVQLVGRINNDIENLGENCKKRGYVELEVAVARLEEKGFDIITIKLEKILGENAVQFLHRGDLIAIKGKLNTEQGKNKTRKLTVVGNSITYISGDRKEDVFE